MTLAALTDLPGSVGGMGDSFCVGSLAARMFRAGSWCGDVLENGLSRTASALMQLGFVAESSLARAEGIGELGRLPDCGGGLALWWAG